MAVKLAELGIRPGDKIAFIGDTFRAYWARLARVRIIAEITRKDAPTYWAADEALKARVMEAFAAAGAKAVVTDSLPPAVLDGRLAKDQRNRKRGLGAPLTSTLCPGRDHPTSAAYPPENSSVLSGGDAHANGFIRAQRLGGGSHRAGREVHSPERGHGPFLAVQG